MLGNVIIMKHLIFIEKEISIEREKRIKSNLRKINNALIDLVDMGYDMYLAPNMLNVCDEETHTGKNCERNDNSVVASISVRGIDAGDW